MDILTWIIVGLIAGLLASVVAGGIGFSAVRRAELHNR